MKSHDELMYEVREGWQTWNQIANFLKRQMEDLSSHLKVDLPVIVPCRHNWGKMQKLTIKNSAIQSTEIL